jgi:imidazole glycerol-phosphate synthase subunit HisF
MLKKRLIASLLIKNGLIVQSFNFDKYLPIGIPRFPIEFVVKWDVDEIIILDMSATPENRSPNLDIVKMCAEYCFVPLTIGGGIKSVEDVASIIKAGADKVAINKSAIENPSLITDIANKFGSQCIVISIDAKKEEDGTYQVYSDSGKIAKNISPSEWAQKCSELGAGEIFLNSIDNDGQRNGYDIDLISSVTRDLNIPVIACGGVGSFEDFSPGILKGGASAVSAANIFHHIEHSTILAKAHMKSKNIDVRLDSNARYDNRTFDDDGRLLMHSGEYLSNLDLTRSK